MYLHLGLPLNSLEADVDATSGVYAVVFSPRDVKALLSSSLTLSTYTKSNHNNYAIQLTKHTERTKYYHKDIASSGITLPDTDEGEHYEIEYWQHPGTGVYNRDADTLVSIDKFSWLNSSPINVHLGDYQQDQIASKVSDSTKKWTTGMCLSYNSDTRKVEYAAWLLLNGEKYTSSTRCQLTWYKRNMSDKLAEIVTTTNTNGVFIFEQVPIALPADKAYYAEVTIRDADGTDHTTPAPIATWD